MKQFEINVRDALGHTFSFTYQAENESIARELFWQKLRKINKRKERIAIIEVKEIK